MAEYQKPKSEEYQKWIAGAIYSQIEQTAEEMFEEVKKQFVEKLEKRKAEIITGAILHMTEIMRMQDGQRELHIVIAKEDVNKK